MYFFVALTMTQHKLFHHSTQQSVRLQSLALEIDTTQNHYYHGLLEVNSNKFWIEFHLDEDGIIIQFEIMSARGYFELTIPIIKVLRNITINLLTLIPTQY